MNEALRRDDGDRHTVTGEPLEGQRGLDTGRAGAGDQYTKAPTPPTSRFAGTFSDRNHVPSPLFYMCCVKTLSLVVALAKRFLAVGSPEERDTVPTAWIAVPGDARLSVVTAAQTFTPRRREPFGGEHPRGRGVFVSSSDFEALIGELESLRAEVDTTRVRERPSLSELASELTRVATVAGGAGPGSIVKVADRAGRISEYELILREGADHDRLKVTLTSSVGKALLGARPGDYVQITLSNGRRRRVRVIDIAQAPAGAPRDVGDSNA
jgi:hypothetical protein